MEFWNTWKRRVDKKYRVIYKRGPSRAALFFAGVAIASWVSFLLLSGYPVVQYIYYTVRPATSGKLATLLSQVKTKPSESVKNEEKIESDLPEVDVSKPGGEYLMIPTLGVDSVIWEQDTENYEKALRRGVWRVPEMPIPTEGSPVILAAHRFGYLEWTNEFRRKNSFFNLPKLQPGDKIEILWEQRLFKYEVKRVVEGEEIDDYDVDLILYTCKFLVSPTRIFVYADRVN
ncbi:MAG: sortase [bacterium]